MGKRARNTTRDAVLAGRRRVVRVRSRVAFGSREISLEWTLVFFVVLGMACWLPGKVEITMASAQHWRYRGTARAALVIAASCIQGWLSPLDQHDGTDPADHALLTNTARITVCDIDLQPMLYYCRRYAYHQGFALVHCVRNFRPAPSLSVNVVCGVGSIRRRHRNYQRCYNNGTGRTSGGDGRC